MARLRRLVAALLVGALVALPGALAQAAAPGTDDAQALLSLPAACPNWDVATAALPGAAWQAGTPPCGDADGNTPAWKGVNCTATGAVAALQLGGLGLQGTLPSQLAGLGTLAALDLSGNAFRGALPPAWLAPGGFGSLASADLSANELQGTLPSELSGLAGDAIRLARNAFAGPLPPALASPTLRVLDLANNSLTGSLPPAWGDGALPALGLLLLEGNALQGMIPMPEWTAPGAFADPSATVVLRQQNAGVCGPVVPLDPQLFPAENLDRNATLIPAANLMHTGEQMTTLILAQEGLFQPGSSVTITNWLGSCMTPCDQVAGGLTQAPANVAAAGLPWPPTITTNVYDLSWQYNMTMADLLQLNPGAAWLGPGAQPRLPCYPAQGAIPFAYYGGDVAFGQFGGGNQVAGPEGLPGAMAAARINAGIPNTFHWPSIYTGAAGPGGAVVQPVFWFSDMLAAYHVSNVLLTAGAIMTNVSVYVGTSAASVTANTRIAAGLNLAAGQQVAIAGRGVLGRYVVVYTGMLDEGTIAMDDVQVYAYESNAAHLKPVAASAASFVPGAAAASLAALVDNNVSTCVWLSGGADGSAAYATVDLGYSGAVGSVVAVTGPEVEAGARARAYVRASADAPLSEDQACSSDGRELTPGTWTVGACAKRGRYVTLLLPQTTGGSRLQLCELQASVTVRPDAAAPPDDGGGGGGLSGGATAGIVVGAVLGAALAALAGGYLWWRRRWLAHQQRMAALSASAKGFNQEHWDRQHAHELQGSSSGGAKGELGDGGTVVAGGGPRGAPAPAVAAVRIGGYGNDGTADEAWGAADVEAGKGGSGAGGKGGDAAGKGGAAPPPKNGGARARRAPGERLSELGMMREYVRALLGRRTLVDLSSSMQYRSRTTSAFAFSRARAGAGAVDTDVTKLPAGFSEVAPADIQLVEIVGEGSFGEVWLGRYCGALVAVKILAKVGSDNLTGSTQHALLLRSLRKEAELMSKLRHPNVCLYLGACTSPPSLLFEYCAKSSLDMLLRAGLRHPQMARRLTWARLLGMALDAAKGMLYLHSRAPPIAHRDLKSANLLVDSQWRVKVADFSLSRTLELGATAMTVVQSNPRWLAPEVLAGRPGQLAADVWAFGTCLWELATWRLPFDALNTFQIIALVQRTASSGLPVPQPGDLPAGPFAAYPQYAALMRACWRHDPAGRPGFDAIVEQLGLMLAAELAPAQAAAAAAASEMPPRRPPDGRPSSRRQQRTRVAAAHGSSGSSGSGSGSAPGLSAALPPGIPEGAEGGLPPPAAAVPGSAKAPGAPPPSADGSSRHSQPAAAP